MGRGVVLRFRLVRFSLSFFFSLIVFFFFFFSFFLSSFLSFSVFLSPLASGHGARNRRSSGAALGRLTRPFRRLCPSSLCWQWKLLFCRIDKLCNVVAKRLQGFSTNTLPGRVEKGRRVLPNTHAAPSPNIFFPKTVVARFFFFLQVLVWALGRNPKQTIFFHATFFSFFHVKFGPWSHQDSIR